MISTFINFHNFLEILAFSAIIVFGILKLEFVCVIVIFSIKFSLNFFACIMLIVALISSLIQSPDSLTTARYSL